MLLTELIHVQLKCSHYFLFLSYFIQTDNEFREVSSGFRINWWLLEVPLEGAMHMYLQVLPVQHDSQLASMATTELLPASPWS